MSYGLESERGADGVRDAIRDALEDLNGDGRDELLRILADRLVCQSVQGEMLWETPALANPTWTSGPRTFWSNRAPRSWSRW